MVITASRHDDSPTGYMVITASRFRCLCLGNILVLLQFANDTQFVDFSIVIDGVEIVIDLVLICDLSQHFVHGL